MYSTFGRGGDPERDRRGAGGGGLSVSWPHLSFDDPLLWYLPALGSGAVELRIRRCTCHSPRWTPRWLCQEQDGGLMHSYWRLAVALLTIGELGAVVARWMVPSWNSASRRLNHLRLDLAQVCGRGGLTRAAKTHDSSSERAMTRLSKSACQIWRRGCTPGCSGRGQPVCPCRIIPRPRPRPRRRPRCCRCPRASPGPAEKP